MKKIKKIYCVFALLLAIGIIPVFFRFDAGGAVRFSNPWASQACEKNTSQGCHCAKNPPQNGACVKKTSQFILNFNCSLGRACAKNPPQCCACAKNTSQSCACAKNPPTGRACAGNPLKYVNAFMGVAAYVMVIVLLIALLRILDRKERRQRLLENPDFDRIFGAAAKTPNGSNKGEAEANDGIDGLRREFLQEMIRVYFDKEGD